MREIPIHHQARFSLHLNPKLIMDVPGIAEEDIDIELDDGQLTIKDQRVAVSDSSRTISNFSQSFYLEPTVDVDSFTATLKNDVLVVSAL